MERVVKIEAPDFEIIYDGPPKRKINEEDKNSTGSKRPRQSRSRQSEDGASSTTATTDYIECLEQEIATKAQSAELPLWFRLGILRIIQNSQTIREEIRELLAKMHNKK